AGRYRGLRGGQQVSIPDGDAPGLLVRPEVARKQMDAEIATTAHGVPGAGPAAPFPPGAPGAPQTGPGPIPTARPKRFHGTVTLEATRVGRDASRIADEVIAHLSGLIGSKVEVTLEINAKFPTGAPEQVVRTVTENSRTLKFSSQGFEQE